MYFYSIPSHENKRKFTFSRPHLLFLNRITATLNFRPPDWLHFASWRKILSQENILYVKFF